MLQPSPESWLVFWRKISGMWKVRTVSVTIPLWPEAFWVNPHEAVRRLTKLLQAARARDVGLIRHTRLWFGLRICQRIQCFKRFQGSIRSSFPKRTSYE